MGFPSTRRELLGEIDVDRAAHRLGDAVAPVGRIEERRVRRVRDIAGLEQYRGHVGRSEEHTSELQSLMRSSYAVFCLKKKKEQKNTQSIQRRCHDSYTNT